MMDYVNYADIAAIPMFLLFIDYFRKIKNKTNMEKILYFFSIVGFVVDTTFTFLKLQQIK
jgi:uncharacterized membrane protein